MQRVVDGLVAPEGSGVLPHDLAVLPELDALGIGADFYWPTDGATIHAPAHMGVFGKLQRLRLVTEPQAAQFTSFLGTVRVTNVLLDLLNTKQLALGRISAEYAQRIVAFDYSKYETASHRIVEETLRPFGESVGVNFFDD